MNSFSAISWQDQVTFNEFGCVLHQHVNLDFYSTSWLKQQSPGRHVTSVGQIIMIQSKPVFALLPLHAVC